MRVAQTLIFSSILLLTGCSSSESTEVNVVVSTNILGDVVKNIVACGGGSVEVLMPIGASAHDFSVSSKQAADMTMADLVVLNGLGLESGLDKVIENVESEGGRVFEVGDNINPLSITDEASGEDHSHDDHNHAEEHEHGEFDPHFWLDMSRMSLAALTIGEELTDVTGDATYNDCAESVSADILKAETTMKTTLNSISETNRLLVVDHESFNYFAEAYNFEVVGSLIPSISDNAQPSSEELAALVKLIQQRDVKAIFVGSDNTKKLADALSSEIGRPIEVVKLYEGSLGTSESDVDTYIKLMMFNADAIYKALN